MKTMPDDTSVKYSKPLDSTAQYYLNRRIDSLEENMNRAFDNLQVAIHELAEDLQANNTQINAVFSGCQENCNAEAKVLRRDIDSLIGYRNRAIGVVGVIVLLLGLAKIG